MERSRQQPMQLARGALIAAFLAPSRWFLTFLPLHVLSASDLNRALVFLVPALVGMTSAWWGESRFKRGFLEGKWTEEELAAVRSLLRASGWKWLGFAEFAVYTWTVFFAPHGSPHGLHSGAFVYIFIFPLGTASRLLQAIAPVRTRSGKSFDWKNFKPIQSEHWGEPVKHGE